jgi:hypothetical protein
MIDFTVGMYVKLLETLKSDGYNFQTYASFIRNPKPKSVILRHDVDTTPSNSLQFAQIESEMNIMGTYYFRVNHESTDSQIIKDIYDLGHEIGYHYETVDTADGDIDDAWHQFETNLDWIRTLAPVETICMHGSPRSRYDNKQLWEKYDYRDFGIIGEPYIDLDFQFIFYLTDTGRKWDGWKTSIRDKVSQQSEWMSKGLVFHTSNEIMDAVRHSILPDSVMITLHPQRWHSKFLPWVNELVTQNIKNLVKFILLIRNR